MSARDERDWSRRSEFDSFAAELAPCELTLNGCRALRLAGVVAAPLAAALFAQAGWLAGLCWATALWLFFPLLRGWGYSYMALLVAVLTWYALLVTEHPPAWARAAGVLVTLAMVVYVKWRLARIRLCRTAPTGAGQDVPEDRACARARL